MTPSSRVGRLSCCAQSSKTFIHVQWLREDIENIDFKQFRPFSSCEEDRLILIRNVSIKFLPNQIYIQSYCKPLFNFNFFLN